MSLGVGRNEKRNKNILNFDNKILFMCGSMQTVKGQNIIVSLNYYTDVYCTKYKLSKIFRIMNFRRVVRARLSLLY